ncbi:hypothetical protein SELMODRAFT_416264 [Selaginella moellendorffii]|uniref:Uncharacterized protein n=1 Tax=Selaginella moellendorffii TaxID=88036 RepID=D8RYR1_SELML|nr:hypothetical protein SELMODRAFT_416264 [Selaginella moellendorffii]
MASVRIGALNGECANGPCCLLHASILFSSSQSCDVLVSRPMLGLNAQQKEQKRQWEAVLISEVDAIRTLEDLRANGMIGAAGRRAGDVARENSLSSLLVRVRRGPAIMIDTTTLEQKLADRVEEAQDFKDLCSLMKAEITKMTEEALKDLVELHKTHFHPTDATNKLKDSEPGARDLEKKFLGSFHSVLEKCNFQQVTEVEWKEAKHSKYLLRLKIGYKKSKLDNQLLQNAPGGSNLFENLFSVYHRGVGIDTRKGFYFIPKLKVLWWSFWRTLWKSKRSKSSPMESEPAEIEEGNDRIRTVQRIHVEDIKIENLFQRVQLQEPTFSQVVVLYRLKQQEYKYGIYIRQFREIPIADLEIVMPEKTTPRLGKSEWFQLAISAAAAGVGFWQAFGRSRIKLGLAILTLIFSYSFKVYYTFQANVLEYGKLISKEIYEKQRDTGPATLLCLVESALQQEVNEAIVAYFGLLMKNGAAKSEELKRQCEAVLIDEVDLPCDFEVEDAVRKLEALQIAWRIVREDVLLNVTGTLQLELCCSHP